MRRIVLLFLLLAPLAASISFSSTSVAQSADTHAVTAAASACPPTPVPTQSPFLESPEKRQAAFAGDTPTLIPTNARLRVPSYVGPADSVAVDVRVNGAPIAFSRSVEDRLIELRPSRALPARASVVVSVAGIRTATYHVDGGPDLAPPVLARPEVSSVLLRLAGPACPPSEPADRIDGVVDVDDASDVTMRGELVRRDGRKVGPFVVYASRHRTSLGTFTTKSLLGVRLAPGTLAPGEHVTLRLTATDIAGNESVPLEIPVVAPASSAKDAGAAKSSALPPPVPNTPSPSERRGGCG